jgi:hypothetical protein
MVEVGQPAPDFELPNQNANKVRLSELRGQKVVVYFYAKADTRLWNATPWPPTCQAQPDPSCRVSFLEPSAAVGYPVTAEANLIPPHNTRRSPRWSAARESGSWRRRAA